MTKKKVTSILWKAVGSIRNGPIIPYEEFKELEHTYNSYMVMQALSMDSSMAVYLEEVNTKYGVTAFSKYVHYRMLWSRIPKSRRTPKWIKKSIKAEDKVKLEPIMHFFNIGANQALEYYKMMTPDQIKHIKQLYEMY